MRLVETRGFRVARKLSAVAVQHRYSSVMFCLRIDLAEFRHSPRPRSAAKDVEITSTIYYCYKRAQGMKCHKDSYDEAGKAGILRGNATIDMVGFNNEIIIKGY